jgi:hypothetical protein
MSIAVMRISRSGQSCDGSRCADALQLLLPAGTGVRERVEEQLRDVVDVDAGADLLGRAFDLPVIQLVEARSAAELRGDRGPGRGTDEHVGIEQGTRSLRRFVFDAAQNADFPSDARESPAGQHQTTYRCHG